MHLTSDMVKKGSMPAATLYGAAILWAVLSVLGSPTSTWADNRLEGYYSLSIAAQKEDTRWHFGNPDDNGIPSHYAELKFFANPSEKLEVFSKLRAWANRDDNSTPTVEYYAPPGTAPRATSSCMTRNGSRTCSTARAASTSTTSRCCAWSTTTS